MNEKQVIDKIIEILESTPTTDDLYWRLAQRINKELIQEIRDGYDEVIFQFKRDLNAKDH
jgi:hypothetical protein